MSCTLDVRSYRWFRFGEALSEFTSLELTCHGPMENSEDAEAIKLMRRNLKRRGITFIGGSPRKFKEHWESLKREERAACRVLAASGKPSTQSAIEDYCTKTPTFCPPTSTAPSSAGGGVLAPAPDGIAGITDDPASTWSTKPSSLST